VPGDGLPDYAFSRADSVEETNGESVGKIVDANPTIKGSGACLATPYS